MSVLEPVAEAQRLAQVMKELTRLAGLGQLTSGIAHEINNPVACVLSAVTALNTELRELESLDPAELAERLREMREILADCNQGATRIRDLARDLRSFSRREDNSAALADVGEAVGMALRVTGAHLKRCAQVKTALEPGLLVECATGALAQVLVHLVLNAVQAMEHRTGVTNEITVSARAAGGKVSICVCDNGPGIAEEHLPRLFEPFFSTRPGAPGLGLTSSQELVKRYGGELKVSSRPGEGCTFTIELKAPSDGE